MADKPRILTDGKDMIWSLIPLAILVIAIAGLAGSCSWGFGSSANEKPIPSFDASAGLNSDASSMAFPVREPDVPADWQANSGSTREIESSLSSNVGWIADGGAYIQLTQTDATEPALMRFLVGDEATATGTQEIGGRTWIQYENADKRKAWTSDFGDVRIGIKTIGKDETAQTLAQAVAAATPIAPRPKPTG